MKHKPGWALPLTATLCTILGLLAGGRIADGLHSDHVPTDPTAEPVRPLVLSAATLANLGVRIDRVQPRTFFRTMSVAAVVVDTPRTEQPVFAPIGGRIASIEVERGTVTTPGSTVITLVRDPLPRPSLTLTADVLRPAQESLHESVLELRKAAEEVRIAQTELTRVEKFTGKVGGRDLPIIPRQRAIDLRYQLSRSEKGYERARLELEKHGLTQEQITNVQEGAPVPLFTEETWQRALARNGLWPEEAQRLSNALPADLRALPWVTATIGELAASGLANAELTTWMKDETVSRHFLEFGVLLQRGHTLADLKRLHSLNALEPVVRVVAPDLAGGGSWDVLEVLIKRGAKVEAGDRLLTLHDPRRLFLQTEPVGGEVRAILDAAKEGHDIAARPLIRGAGPTLEGLTISYVESSRENEGTIAFVGVANEVRAEIDRGSGRISRTWALREGMRYLLGIPTQKMEDVYVLPASAVTDSGPDKVVFLQDGDAFKPIPVVIAWQDENVVVIPATKEVMVFPGDPVVQSGAFELGLALRGSAGLDEHAGHNH